MEASESCSPEFAIISASAHREPCAFEHPSRTTSRLPVAKGIIRHRLSDMGGTAASPEKFSIRSVENTGSEVSRMLFMEQNLNHVDRPINEERGRTWEFVRPRGGVRFIGLLIQSLLTLWQLFNTEHSL